MKENEELQEEIEKLKKGHRRNSAEPETVVAKVAGFVRTRRGRRVGCWAGFQVSRRIRETVCAYERGEAKKNE